jgi:hypothetical protein
LRAAFFSAIIGALLSQIAARAEPLHSTAVASLGSGTYAKLAAASAVASVVVLLLGWYIAKVKSNWRIWACILGTGLAAPVIMVHAQMGGRFGPLRTVPLDVIFSILELGICYAPAALAAQWLAPNKRLERARAEAASVSQLGGDNEN